MEYKGIQKGNGVNEKSNNQRKLGINEIQKGINNVI